MKQECKTAGITFIFKRVQSPEEVMDAHPNCEHFIVADGANSKMRAALWGPDCIYRRDILPSLDFKYKAVGQPRYLLKSTFPKLAHIGLENVGMMGPDGLTEVNLRFVVSKGDYEAIPTATFKKPLVVTPNSSFWDRMDKKSLYKKRTFRDGFYDFLLMRQEFAGEKLADVPITMTKIYLSRYTARKFSKTTLYAGRTRGWFLVGDAAMGMPFYRSANSGLILGSQLGLLLSKTLSVSQKVMVYNFLMRPARVVQEFVRIKYLEYKAHALLKVIRPVLFHAARVPGLRFCIVRTFDHVAWWRGARIP
jgi:2-polyprenyl-6-methoxyphenol hydroxylase-like FAD-dependent oxidoreductase